MRLGSSFGGGLMRFLRGIRSRREELYRDPIPQYRRVYNGTSLVPMVVFFVMFFVVAALSMIGVFVNN
jgi:phosphotransferase system  glucose/maltose/N-acetylglucosamine-specific IIC component